MTNNKGSRNWNDVQLVLAALAMTLTLGLWNIFAEPDLAHAKESAKQQPPTPPATEFPTVAGTPTAMPPIKILLGGVAPQVTIVQQPSARRGGRDNGGGGGGGPVTTTRSS